MIDITSIKGISNDILRNLFLPEESTLIFLGHDEDTGIIDLLEVDKGWFLRQSKNIKGLLNKSANEAPQYLLLQITDTEEITEVIESPPIAVRIGTIHYDMDVVKNPHTDGADIEPRVWIIKIQPNGTVST